MSAQGAATNFDIDGAIRAGDSSRDLIPGETSSDAAEADVLRNALSAVMLEYHEQSKKFTTERARHSQEIAALTAKTLQLSRDVAALALERDALRSQRSELESRLVDIESSTSWRATRRMREMFTRHPRLRGLVTRIRRALARP